MSPARPAGAGRFYPSRDFLAVRVLRPAERCGRTSRSFPGLRAALAAVGAAVYRAVPKRRPRRAHCAGTTLYPSKAGYYFARSSSTTFSVSFDRSPYSLAAINACETRSKAREAPVLCRNQATRASISNACPRTRPEEMRSCGTTSGRLHWLSYARSSRRTGRTLTQLRWMSASGGCSQLEAIFVE